MASHGFSDGPSLQFRRDYIEVCGPETHRVADSAAKKEMEV